MTTASGDSGNDVPPPVGFLLSSDTLPAGQETPPPQPPAWVTSLTPNQRAAWTALASADLTGQASVRLTALAEALKPTAPPADAQICAEFFVLRAQLRDLPDTNTADQLLAFAQGHAEVRAESGIRLTSLAIAAVLGQRPAHQPTAALWAALKTETSQNGFLAPRLLDEAATWVRDDRELSESLQAMRFNLAERQLRGELAEALVHAGYHRPISITNLWLNAHTLSWFALVAPIGGEGESTAPIRLVSTSSSTWQARFFPQFMVQHAISNALVRAGVTLPNYFALTGELGDRPLVLPALWNRFSEIASNAAILAEGRFQLTEPLTIDQPRMYSAPMTQYESMPSHPTLVLRVLLADRHLLYARQRELQWIFGSLIALALGTALIGLAAARHAFHRQLQLNEQKSNFVSSVSHELRAPIASVRLMAENLERGKITGPGRQAEYFRFIVQECRRLSSLIENVLDVSRIEQGRKQYEFEPTDLRALTEATVKLMEPYATEKGVRLHFETTSLPASSAHIELNVDGRAIQQALVNLIDNAMKHSPDGQMVTVGPSKLRSGGALVRLTVSDRGPGIPTVGTGKNFRALLSARLRTSARNPGRGHRLEHRQTHRRGPWRPGAGGKRTRPRQPLHYRVAHRRNHE